MVSRRKNKSELPPPERSSIPAAYSNYTLETCVQRIIHLESEKESLEKRLIHMENDTMRVLETRLESLKDAFTLKIQEVYEDVAMRIVNNKQMMLTDAVPLRGKRKIFLPQDSLFTKMLEEKNENYRTIFNIVLTILILWGLFLTFNDVQEKGVPNFDLLIWGVVRDLRPFFSHWIILFLASFIILPLSHFTEQSNGSLFSFLLCVYIVLQITFFYYSKIAIFNREVPFSMPLGIGLMAEQCRFSMKMHAYFREKLLWYKWNGNYAIKPKNSAFKLPFSNVYFPDGDYFVNEISKYSYFLFVPTLIYRDQYPRTNKVRWRSVFVYLLECCGVIYYAFVVFRTALPQFEFQEIRRIELFDFIHFTFKNMGTTMAIMIFCHYLVLHLVQNLFGELTRFADRNFYSNWWNSRTFTVFYREWNGVVHDFIHSYIYLDLVEFMKFPKLVSLLSCFIISAMVHEYLIAISMGFFLPILMILFTGPGLLFILLTKNKTGRIWNIFMWLMLSTGNAMLLVIYCREYYMRNKGSLIDPTTGIKFTDYGIYDYLIPRTIRIQFPNLFIQHD